MPLWKNDIDLDALLQLYALQRKPYITLADCLDGLYQEFKSRHPGLQVKAAPMDFTLLEHGAYESVFHFILSYSSEKFASILRQQPLLAQLVEKVYEGANRDQRDIFHRDRVRNVQDSAAIDFLTSVFHLSFAYRVPIQFNPGRIYEQHLKDRRPFYRAELTKQTDRAGLQKIRIGRQVFSQVPDTFYEPYKNGEQFYREWIAVVQNLQDQHTHLPTTYNYHVYLPIYDGLRHRQGVLRGILGIYFSDRDSRNSGLDYFRSQADLIQNQINQAFLIGMSGFILDGYLDSNRDPLDYLQKRLGVLHHWRRIDLCANGPHHPHGASWWLQGHTLYIALEQILSRKQELNYQVADLLDRYHHCTLALDFPELTQVDLHPESPFVLNRVSQWMQLLDLLLEKRSLLSSIETTRNAGRKSAVAAIMSRNMSHNIGSHVLTRLAHRTEPANGYEMARFHSYLATRMDFLADVSTQSGGVVIAKRFYRDLIHEFKTQQTLLLDLISGADLTAEQIRLICFYDNKPLTLAALSHDPLLAMPNDVLGSQALYVILENMIRNCAKHASIRDELLLELRLDPITQYGSAYYRLRIRDHLATCIDQPDLLPRINAALQRPVIRQDGSLQQGHWGLLEMKIAAAYLRHISAEKIDLTLYQNENPAEPPLLRAVEVDHCLCYELYLLKPHFLQICYPQQWSLTEERRVSLAIAGIDCSCNPTDNMHLSAFTLFLDHTAPLPDRTNPAPRQLTITTDPLLSKWRDLLQQAGTEEMMAQLMQVRNQQLWGEIPQLTVAWSATEQTDYTLSPSSHGRVLFDLHGDWYKKNSHRDETESLLFYQSYGSVSPTGLLLNGLAGVSETMRNWMIGEFLEAAWTTVAIIDERVQQQALLHCDPLTGWPLQQLYQKMRIHTPPEHIDLNRRTLCSTEETLLWAWMLELVQKLNLTFLVIHLGIVEKFVGTEPSAVQSWFDRLEKYLERPVTCLIISGRGTPAHLPNRPFLPYSLIAQYVLDQPSKYHLSKILFAGLGRTSW